MGDSGVICVCVDPERVKEFWPSVKDMLKGSIDRAGLSTFDWLESGVLEGRQLLWLAWNGSSIEAVATTQLSPPVCVLTALWGRNRSRWLHVIADLERYAINEGCTKLRWFGRKGWQRVMPDYKMTNVVMEKDLTR